jgi:hypothetical protein
MSEDTTASIFAELETTAMLFAYIHKIEGRDGLLWLLNESEAKGWPWASLMNAADELTQMDMPAVAEVIAEAASSAAEPTNPFPENTANWRNWNRRFMGDFTGFLGGKS